MSKAKINREEIETEKEGSIHHYYHKPENIEGYREVTINSGTFSISLTSNAKEETIPFLISASLHLLKKLKEEQ